MSNRFYAAIATIAVIVIFVWNSAFVVSERQQALVLRFGEIQRVISEPGLYFKLPFGFAQADNVQLLPNRLLRSDLNNLRVQVSGGAFYDVDAFMVYRIEDPALFRRGVRGGQLDEAERLLLTRFDSAIRATYGRRSFSAALSDERASMMVEVRDQVRPEAQRLGIDLIDVRIGRTDLTPEISERTYERMAAERLAEAERLRADGQVRARTVRATADREASETVAAARRDAAILQGEGEAERNATFAAAFGQNPEFFEFYRSMQAYKTALDGTGTTMVLSPTSEFFRYFNTDNANMAAPSVPTSAAPAVPAAGAN
ncbi:protease modulator HflC [Aureimonas fodinaquatilis]|uniref:Protein HflC n=1 Tax=Aureimonas fodinaquatilis TaxID=2565783 RepID=A0A5B0E1S1_9HYPH|nr:protease modulator HflC [Aureimonas fodinaquatilis]KAA0972242.1 protease modulator HflC [Aureimonas fodinaquatilis]